MRRIKLPIRERKGDLTFALLEEAPPPPWDKLVTVISQEVWNHALYGYTEPLNKKLGRPPSICLALLPFQHCCNQKKCVTHDSKVCLAKSPDRPWCFEPEGGWGQEVVALWGESVYVLWLT